MSYIDMGSVQYRVSEFDKKHGASIYDQGWYRFEDGAMRESDPMGALMDPPDDPYDRAKRIAYFRKVILARAVRAFDQLKTRILSMANGNLSNEVCGPAPQVEQAADELRALQVMAKAAQKKFDAAVAAVEANKPAYLRSQEQQNINNRRANEALAAKISSIDL